MRKKFTIKLALTAVAVALWLFISSPPAAAQCAMCKNALTNSPDTAKLAQNFNYAVFVLLIPPVLLFCGIFIAAYKFRKAPEQPPEGMREPKTISRLLLDKLRAAFRRRKRGRREVDGALV